MSGRNVDYCGHSYRSSCGYYKPCENERMFQKELDDKRRQIDEQKMREEVAELKKQNQMNIFNCEILTTITSKQNNIIIIRCEDTEYRVGKNHIGGFYVRDIQEDNFIDLTGYGMLTPKSKYVHVFSTCLCYISSVINPHHDTNLFYKYVYDNEMYHKLHKHLTATNK